MFYKIENERDFVNSVKCGTTFHIHNYYGSPPFSSISTNQLANFEKICVVRDPVERLLSCYSNRVRFYKELDEKHLTREAVLAGATPNPTLDVFVERLEIYRKYSASIRHHTEPHVHFIGKEQEFYSKIYRMSEVADLALSLSNKIGMQVQIPHDQTGGSKIFASDLSIDTINKIREFYKDDYNNYLF